MARSIGAGLAMSVAFLLFAPSTKAQSVTVEQHVEFIDALYEYVGLSKMGLKRSEFGSCAGCVPIILYCRKKVRKKTDVRGQAVVARGAAADFVRKYGDTAPQLLPLGEFSAAYRTGIVDCKATGGGLPKWGLDGPIPPSLKRVNLPKSRLPKRSAAGTGSDLAPAKPAAPPAQPKKADDLKSLEDF